LWEKCSEIAQYTAIKPLFLGYMQAAAINGGFEGKGINSLPRGKCARKAACISAFSAPTA